MMSKYTVQVLAKAFRKAAAFRNEMVADGFTDNGGAIHAAERILDLLGQRMNYPGLAHLNNLRHYADAEFSVAARAAHRRGEAVLIEHVAPHRALTRKCCEALDKDQFLDLVRVHYRLVLLTPDETRRLNKVNRSRMTPDRLSEAGIKLAK